MSRVQVDAWMQHPTPRFLRQDAFASQRRWTGDAIPDEAPPVEMTVAATVRLDRSAGWVPVRMRVRPGDSDMALEVRARIGGRWTVVGRARTHVEAAGQVRARVQVARKWRRRLDGHAVKARLDVDVTTSAGVTTSSRERFLLRG